MIHNRDEFDPYSLLAGKGLMKMALESTRGKDPTHARKRAGCRERRLSTIPETGPR
jgi:hypothetical protein